MATRQQFKQSTARRRSRRFSDSFKRQKVREIESGVVTVTELSRIYEVRRNSIYKWLKKYGKPKKSTGVRTVVELESDSLRLQAAERKIAKLERALGQKQLQLQYLEKVVELAEKEHDLDLKKTFEEPL